MRLPRIEIKRGDPRDATSRAVGSGFGGFYTNTITNAYRANWELDKAVKRGYEVLIDVFRCVDAISQNQAGLEMFVQRGLRDRGHRVNDEQLEYVLNTRSNPYETAWQFRYRLSGQLLLSTKGAFVEVVPNREKRVAQLHLYHPNNVEPIPDPKRFVSGYRVTRSDGTIDEMEPDQVIWLRLKPHPTDPYSQMTPMQAAGLTVETEFLARIFNRAVVSNNGKPEQLISIGELLNQEDGKEIKYRLQGRDPSRAGGATVIEATNVRVDNLMATPAELQYLQGLDMDKEEVYIAFGTPESVLGNASGRTYDNADAERYNWWNDTMQPHCDGIAACLDVLTEGGLEDDLFVKPNYSKIDVLQLPMRQKKNDMQGEVKAGLRTIDSYLTEIGEVPFQVPATQVLYVPAVGMLPIGKEDDTTQAVIQLSEQAQGMLGPQQPGMTPEQQQQASYNGALAGWNAGQQQLANDTAARALQVAGKALEAMMERKAIEPPPKDEHEVIDVEEAESDPMIDTGPLPFVWNDEEDEFEEVKVIELPSESHPYAELRAEIEGTIEGMLTTWSRRQSNDVLARLDGKARRGTRHWDYTGETPPAEFKALDPRHLIDPDKWADDIIADMSPLFDRVIDRQMKKTARELQAYGLVERIVRMGRGNPYAGHPAARLFGQSYGGYRNVKNELVGQAENIIRNAAHNQTRRMMNRITNMDQAGASKADIAAEVKRMTGARSVWRKQLAVNITTDLVEGAIAKACDPVREFIDRTWHAHVDARTRPAHRRANGQKRSGVDPFNVGGVDMMHPGDPTAPPELVVNCRCWQTVAVKSKIPHDVTWV